MTRVSSLSLLGFLVLAGCGDKKAAPSAPPAAQTALEDAEDDVGKLCAVAEKFAGTAEATRAMDKVRAAHARAMTDLPRLAAERSMPPEVLAMLEAKVRGSAGGKECDRLIGVHVAVGFDALRTATTSNGTSIQAGVRGQWPHAEVKLADPVEDALAQLTAGWLATVDAREPTSTGINLFVEIVPAEAYVFEGGHRMPTIAAVPVAELRGPGLEARKLPLERITFDAPSGVHVRTVQGDKNPESSAMAELERQMVRQIASGVSGLPRQLGLAAAQDPALARFAGRFHVIEVNELANDCDGRGGAPTENQRLSIDAGARTVELGSDLRATVDGDRLIATGSARSFDCPARRNEERLEVAWKDDRLEGTHVDVFAHPEDCARTCTARNAFVAAPEIGTRPLSERGAAAP